MKLKKIGLIFLFSIILILILIYSAKNFIRKDKKESVANNTKVEDGISEKSNTVTITSTNPSPLDGIIIQADQVIEIRFSTPLQNPDEFRHTITPKVDYKIELIDNKKTVKITPLKPFPLGEEYTIRISPETKFDNGSKLPDEKIFHFKTVAFRGF